MPNQPTPRDFQRMTRRELHILSRAAYEPKEVRREAAEALDAVLKADLKAAFDRFEDATPIFAEITDRLIDVIETARLHPGSSAAARLNPLLRDAADLHDEASGTPKERSHRATDAGDGDAREPRPRDEAPVISTDDSFHAIADELVRLFDTMVVHSDHAAAIEHMRRRLTTSRRHYVRVADSVGVPWHLVGIIHMRESSFDFGSHLHNGDSLTARTTRVPKDRPETGDPPFLWPESAEDALRYKDLHHVEDWSLARQLYTLEQYNGFGYRNQGIATPYLWSFSKHYTRGLYVRDHEFNPDAVSKQVGGAVMMKAMIDARDIVRPA